MQFAFKKKLAKLVVLLLVFCLFPSHVFAVATDINTALTVKNYTDGGSLAQTASADPGDTVMFHLYMRNDGAVNAENLKVDFTPHPITGGTAYPGPDVGSYRAYHYNDSGGGTTEYISLADLDLDGSSGGNGDYLMTTVLPPTGYDQITYIYVKIPDTYASSTFTLTATPSCDNTCNTTGGGTNIATVNVNVDPVVSNVLFTPSAIPNDGGTTTIVTADVSDPNIPDNIASVKINLSSIGGSSTETMYDDGSHGDGAASDGKYGATGITTSASPATYSNLTVTATDGNSNTATADGSLIVQAAGTPIITLNSVSKSVLSNQTGYTSSIINWQSSQICGTGASQGYRVERGGSGTPESGTQLVGWTTTCLANTAIDTTINNTDINSGANTIYIYILNNNGTGYNTTSLELDTTAPTPSVASYTSTVSTGNANFQWYANENGTWTVRVGGNGTDPTSGVQITGNNASGTYTDANAASSDQILSIVNNSDLSEGNNTVYVYLTDDGGNIASANATIAKDSTPQLLPPTNVGLTDNDNTIDSGIDGRDFTVSWTKPTEQNTIDHFQRYDLYLLPNGTTINTSTHSSGGSVTDINVETWTGSSTLTIDGTGTAFATGNYVAWIVVASDNVNYEDSDAAPSPSVTITSEVPTPPVFQTASFIDNTTLQLTFDSNLHTTLSQHTATGITSGDFTVDSSSGTNGVDSVSGHNIFIKLNALNNAALTSTDLDINTGAVIGSNNGQINQILNQSVSDGQNPTITFTAPADNAFDNNSENITVSYQINENAQSNSVKARFLQTGGVADSNSPHTITLSGETAATPYNLSIDGSSFTSFENGAGDALVNGSVYSITMLAKDTVGNSAANVTHTDFTYDTESPSTPVAVHFPSAVGANGQHTNNTTPELNWLSSTDNVSSSGNLVYNLDLSLFSDFSVNTQTYTDVAATLQELTTLSTETTYYWRVNAVDQATNTGSYQGTAEYFVFDDTPPIITSPTLTDTTLSNTDYTSSGNTVVLTATLTDTNRDVITTGQITADLSSLGGGAAVNPTSYVGATGVATWASITAACTDGSKNIPIDASDLASNNAIQVNATIICDSTAPVVGANAITSPNGAENWAGASTHNITWTSGDITETNLESLTLQYSSNNGSSWTEIATGELNDGTYSWTPLPSIDTSQTLIRLIAIDQVTQTGSDVSNATFIIDSTNPTIQATTLTAPNGGEDLKGGSTSNITWISGDITDTYLNANPITLEYYNGSIWVEIANTEGNDGTFSWNPVPSLNITNAQGRLTAYDLAGNSASDTSDADFSIDSNVPTVSSAETQDLDGNGKIDAIKFILNENILDSSVTASNFDIAGYIGEAFSSTTNADVANNDVIYITFTEGGTVDSGAKPNYTYTQGTLVDLAGNLLATIGATATTDKAIPIVVSRETQDANSDGQQDGALITFSENMDASAVTNVDFELKNSAGTPLTETYSDAVDDTTLLVGFTDGDSFDTDDLTQMQLSGNFQDLSGNTILAEGSFTSAIDSVNPVFQAATWIATITPAVKVIFSEPVDSANDDHTDWAVAGFTVTAMDSLNGSTISTLLSLNTDITDTSITPNVTYTAGDIVDTSGNVLQNGIESASDNLAPTINQIEIRDTDSNGSTETAYIEFSENIDDSTLTVSGFSLGSITANNFSTNAFGTNTVDDHLIAISLNTGIEGTIVRDVIYTNSIGGLTDLAVSPNALADVSSGDIAEQDKSGPALLSATYNDNGTAGDVTDDTITLILSENVDDLTVDTGAGNSDLEFTVTGGGSITNATTTSGTANDETLIVNLNAGDTTLTAGVSTVALISGVIADSGGNTNTNTSAVTTNGAVIINEIMWMGTTLNADDEFIELKNMSSSAVDISGWVIENAASGTGLVIPALSTIAGNGYFLIANYAKGSSKLNVDPDWVTTNLSLANTANGNLVLKNSAIAMDSVKGDTWPAGDNTNKYSMERNSAPGNGLNSGSWHTGDGQTNWDGGATEKGTPRAANVADAQSPTFQLVGPDSRQPAHNTLYPSRFPSISIEYADNPGGTGIDTSATQIFIDLNNDADYNDAGENITGSSSISLTKVSYTHGSALTAGKHNVKVIIQDIAGNSAETEWSFWLDNLTVVVTNAPELNLLAGVADETSSDAEHAKVVINTYGAGITLKGYLPLLVSGGNSIQNWDSATGIGWDVKEDTGAFSETINAMGNTEGTATTFAAKSKMNSMK